MESGAPDSVRDRHIALVKPAEHSDVKAAHAIQLLTSMLWAFRGTTRSNWVSSAPEDAEVIVCHRDDADPRISTWRTQGKLVVEIVTSEVSDTAALYTLAYPFRASTALTLLEQLDDQLTLSETVLRMAATQQPAEATNATYDGLDDWAFVGGLRTQTGDQRPDEWLAAYSMQAQVLWAKPSEGIYVAEQPVVKALRAGELAPAEMRLLPTDQPPPALHSRPISELLWFSAYHAAEQLAPWLSQSVPYRIHRWPNFGVIRPAPTSLRVAAALAKSQLDVGQLASRMHITDREAARNLNALSVLEALVPGTSSVATATRAVISQITSRAGFSTLLRNVRRHLGLEKEG